MKAFPERGESQPSSQHWRWALLAVWAMSSFGGVYFARELSVQVWGWRLHYWLAAQGLLVVYVACVVLYAWQANRAGGGPESDSHP